MQEQLFTTQYQLASPPPPTPYIKPKNQTFFQDQFLLDTLETLSDVQGSHKNSMQDQTEINTYSQAEANQSNLDCEQPGEGIPFCFKRSFSEVHSHGSQHSRYRLLAKLQKMDRLPAKKLHL